MVEIKRMDTRQRRGKRTSVESQPEAGGSANEASCEDMPVRSSDTGCSGSKTSRCSIRQLCSVIETFDGVKKQLVQEIGFEGLLQLPSFNTLNRQFSTWLLTKIDCELKCIAIDDERKIPFFPEDVNTVFGIPCGEKDVLGADAVISDKGIEFIQECIGLSGVNPHSLKPVQEFLLGDLGPKPSMLLKDSFKAAFVVFAMGSFLAPLAKHDYAPISFWGALRCTSEIKNFNWCSYVIKVLLDCARKVQSDIAKKRDVSSISGCHLFLQVLYLDNISIPGLSSPHDVLPRIKAYGSDALNMLISADSNESGFGCHPIRDRESVCYMWSKYGVAKAQDISNQQPPLASALEQTPKPGLIHVTSGSTVNPSQLVYMPSKPAATDLFHFIRAKYPELAGTQLADLIKIHNAKTLKHISNCQANLLNENINMVDNIFGMIKDGTHLEKRTWSRTASKGVSVSSMKTTDIVGKRLELNDCEADSPARGEVHSAQKNPLNELPEKRNSHIPETSSSKKTKHSTPTASQASSNHGDKVFRRSSSIEPVDKSMSVRTAREAIMQSMQSVVLELTVKAAEDTSARGSTLYGQCDKSPIIPRRLRHLPFVKAAWEMGSMHPHHNPNDVDQLFAWCRDDAQPYIRSVWIKHVEPRFIQLTGLDIKRQIVQNDQMTSDMCDMIIRRFKQYDHLMHASAFDKRWRHFFESDFATYVLAGYQPLDVVHVRAQFEGKEVPYNLTTCRMFVVPVFIGEAWACYMIDMRTRTTLVLDPYLMHNPSCPRHILHEHAAPTICNALFQCLNAFFENWPISNDKWCTHYPPLPVDNIDKFDSGIVMLHCARNYTGDELLSGLQGDAVVKARKIVLVDLLTMDDNMSFVPASTLLQKFM